MLLMTAWASAQTDEPRQLRARPSQAAPGESIRVEGEGCAPGAEVSIVLEAAESDREGSVTSASQGGFAATLTIPESVKAGRVWVRARCQNPDDDMRVMQTQILVTRPPLEITFVNLAFGSGIALVVMGFGISLRSRRRGSRPPAM